MPFVSTAEPSVVCLINFVGPRRVRIDFDNTDLLAMIMPLSERLISGLRNVNWSFLPQPAGIHWSKYHNRHRVLHAFWIPTQAKFRDRGRPARNEREARTLFIPSIVCFYIEPGTENKNED